jgi:hypothetical protein
VTQLKLDWKTSRDKAMSHVEAKAGPEFSSRARDFVLKYLDRHGPTDAETGD